MNNFAICITAGLAFLVIGPILWWALNYMTDNAPEPHDQVKGGFMQESGLYKGPRGIMDAAALAESHRSGRQRWQTGRVVLEDKDINEQTVYFAQWLVDNARNFPDWGLRVDNRLSDSPQEVHKRANRQEKPIPVDWDKKKVKR